MHAFSKCATVVHIVSALLTCIINPVDGRPTCRFEDIQPLAGGRGYNLKGCKKLDFVDQQIHDHGAADLNNALRGDMTITDLYLTNTGLSAAGARSIADVLQHTHLRGLYLWRNEIGDEGVKHVAEAMSKHPTVESLYLGYTGMTDQGAKSLAAMLRDNNKLTRLDLRGNDIGDEGAEALASALYNNTRLSEVFLWNNNIGPTGMMHIADALQKNSAVHTLHIHDNRAAPEHYQAIGRALAKNRQVQLDRELVAVVNHIAEDAAASPALALVVDQAYL